MPSGAEAGPHLLDFYFLPTFSHTKYEANKLFFENVRVFISCFVSGWRAKRERGREEGRGREIGGFVVNTFVRIINYTSLQFL